MMPTGFARPGTVLPARTGPVQKASGACSSCGLPVSATDLALDGHIDGPGLHASIDPLPAVGQAIERYT